jgi:hypothetical protein
MWLNQNQKPIHPGLHPEDVVYNGMNTTYWQSLNTFNSNLLLCQKKNKSIPPSLSPEMQKDQREAVNRAFDQTKNNVKSQYMRHKDVQITQQFSSMQEKAFTCVGKSQTTHYITKNFSIR